MKKITIWVLILCVFNSLADEGMWQPHQLPSIAKQLTKSGLNLDPKNLTDLTGFPMGAIVSLGGCTASFVSTKGLVITNHHCAHGSIQYNSSKGNNLIEKGFLAKSFDKELPASPGERVYVTEEIVDVTPIIKKDISENIKGAERYKKIDLASKKLVKNCESDKAYRCSVVNFHGGLEYYLFKQLMIRDVRLVYAPAQSIGEYGGEIDNWQWPRHTGDYAFYRAYVSKDGKPADYNEENVPYQPQHHLKVNPKSVAEGDYIMVVGYPGRTNRYRTEAEVKNTFNNTYPLSKKTMADLINVIKQNSEQGSSRRIKYESLLAGLENYEKNRGSMIQSYNKGKTQHRKDAFNKALKEWVNQSKEREQKFSSAINDLEKLVNSSHENFQRDNFFSFMRYTSMYAAATKLHRLAIEKKKDDINRKQGYQERDLNSFQQGMQRIGRRYDNKIDQAIFKYLLVEYGKVSQDKRIKSLDEFFNNDFSEQGLQKKLNEMYTKTTLHDESVRLDWMKKPLQDFTSSEDPFIQLAGLTFAERKEIEEYEEELSGEFNRLRSNYMQAVIAYNQSIDHPVYADANSTLRITYGNVKGYSPKDGLYAVPFTRLEGITQKNTGVTPFNAPEKQLKLIKNKKYAGLYDKTIDSVPVNYLGTLDITGGNSGSPTLNDKAELVGLVFDGVYESIIGDWDYEPSLNRSIHVDIRYILWVMAYVDGATHLINEMDIIQ